MDNTNTRTIIQERLAALPKEIHDLLQSDMLDTQLQTISGQYSLTPEQRTALENATALALLGMLDDADYRAMLREEIGITETTAGAIAEAVGESIFAPVAEPLARFQADEQMLANTGNAQTPAKTVSAPDIPVLTDTPPLPHTVVENREEREMRIEDVAQPVQKEHKRPVKEYAVDPYREPIE